jgi:AcrR family transcriptional regulator
MIFVSREPLKGSLERFKGSTFFVKKSVKNLFINFGHYTFASILIIKREMIIPKDDAKAKIVEIAREIFTRFGFKKTTMEEIAVASRKGKSSIYYYFNSKEDVFKAVVEREAEEMRDELKVQVLSIEDPVDRLKAFFAFRLKKLKELSNYYAALRSEYLSHLEFVEKIRKNFDQEEIKVVKQILEDGVEKEKFVVDDPALSAVAIVTALKGLEVPLFLSREKSNMESRIDNLINFLFYGIVKR